MMQRKREQENSFLVSSTSCDSNTQLKGKALAAAILRVFCQKALSVITLHCGRSSLAAAESSAPSSVA